MSSLRARLEMLEARLTSRRPVVLVMPDGQQPSLLLPRGEHILDSVLRIVQDHDGEEAAAIRESVSIREPHGRLVECARALLLSPKAFTTDPEEIPEDIENYLEQGE
jgi:hypothetical protein